MEVKTIRLPNRPVKVSDLAGQLLDLTAYVGCQVKRAIRQCDKVVVMLRNPATTLVFDEQDYEESIIRQRSKV
jgi:hypothetical protein